MPVRLFPRSSSTCSHDPSSFPFLPDELTGRTLNEEAVRINPQAIGFQLVVIPNLLIGFYSGPPGLNPPLTVWSRIDFDHPGYAATRTTVTWYTWPIQGNNFLSRI